MLPLFIETCKTSETYFVEKWPLTRQRFVYWWYLCWISCRATVELSKLLKSDKTMKKDVTEFRKDLKTLVLLWWQNLRKDHPSIQIQLEMLCYGSIWYWKFDWEFQITYSSNARIKSARVQDSLIQCGDFLTRHLEYSVKIFLKFDSEKERL